MSSIDDKNITVELSIKETAILTLAMMVHKMRLEGQPSKEARADLLLMKGVMTKIRDAITALEKGQATEETR